MKELTIKEKMELYDDLVREKEISVSRIKTFEHIANSWKWGGRDYSIYYMSKVHDPRYPNGVHKDYRHELNEYNQTLNTEMCDRCWELMFDEYMIEAHTPKEDTK